MKKILSLCFALCLLAALCPCLASSESSGEASGESVVPAEDADVVVLCGDMHGETSVFTDWLHETLDVYGDQLTFLGYSGDVCRHDWDDETLTTFRDTLDEYVPGMYTVTTGNQEFYDGAPGSDWDSLGDGFTRAGVAAETEDYVVYDLGSASSEGAFPQEDIDALADYLQTAPNDVPIFILSHYPLHLSVGNDSVKIPGSGSTNAREFENADKLVELLNQYPNVVFLWGHNHSFSDPRYGTIRGAGSAFTYDYENPADKLTINFTYANFGSLAGGDSYALTAEITHTGDGTQVYLYYMDDSAYMTGLDSAVLTIAADGTVTTQITDGTDIDRDQILTLSGYSEDPDFDAQY